MGYLTNFIVYTLAMAGVIGIALFVFKISQNGGGRGQSKYLKVLDTMSIGPRKNLYIVAAGEEKFLIAGDVDKTTLISKLNPTKSYEEKIPEVVSSENETFPTQSFKEFMKSAEPKKQDLYMDMSANGIRKSMLQEGIINDTPYTSVMKSLATKMRGGV